MSKFYKEIAKYYPYIFPTRKEQINVIKEVVGEPPREILDVACGSGGYAIELSKEGYHVTAIDLDSQMILELKKKNKNIDAHVLNMLDIEKLDKKFDLIFCIGNSLVHLENEEEISQFLKTCKKCLKEEGHLILQIVNYDRILEKNIKNLPTIKNNQKNLVFERYYNYLPKEHKIDFQTILKVEEEQLENHVLLHPIQSFELVKLLKEWDFCNIELYGNFKREAYQPMESFPLVVIAQRGKA